MLAAGHVRGLERRLVRCVRRTDATLLTWTGGGQRPGDRSLYDAVRREAGRGAGPGH
jgi:hypothetical protein